MIVWGGDVTFFGIQGNITAARRKIIFPENVPAGIIFTRLVYKIRTEIVFLLFGQKWTKRRTRRTARTSLNLAPYGIAGGPVRNGAPPECPSGLKT